MEIDVIQLALVQKQLDHISQQMGWVTMRTARSAIFSVSHDFSCFIGDRAGRVIAQADGIPIHTGGGGFALRAVIGRFGEDIHPDDVFILNDPYVAGGNHLPDYTIIRPVFVGSERIGFTCNRGHQADIGGGAAGTYNPAATEIFHEGLRIPVMRLVSRGVMNDDLWRMLLLNTRCPGPMEGDLLAMIGSTRIGGERLATIGDSLGLDTCHAYFDAILDYGERRMRSAIAGLPDGTYFGEDISDTDCFESRDVAIRTTMTVAGDRVTFDFTGTDPQIAGFKNSSLANTCSAVYLSLSTFFPFDIPRNEGTYRCVDIVAPAGTVVNALPPAPVTMCTIFPAHDIINACWRALAQAMPERGCGSWGKSSIANTAGLPDGGEPFVLYHWHGFPGAGALRERDGFNQMGQMTTLGGMMMPNVESWEKIYPMRINRCEFRTDGGGAGEMRGGTGVDYEADMLVSAEYAFRGEGCRKSTGLGVSGGGDGAAGRMTIRVGDGPTEVPPQYAVRRLPPLTIAMAAPGGGGFGNPQKRSPILVLRDVEDGIVSRDAARDIYRVALSPDGTRVDEEETERLRSVPVRGAADREVA